VLARALKAQGLTLTAVSTSVGQLRSSEGLWLANSLLGLMPVAAVDGEKVPISPQSGFLQEILWSKAHRDG
jgi:branched-subunit amino acid aminotransferase/4-amino-4-deoxychorismate lyase